MMKFTVLSCSLDPHSRSARLADLAGQAIAAGGHRLEHIDLREIDMPIFDNDRAFGHPAYAALHEAIAGADGIFIAAPVYNWGLGSAAKNLIELTGATGVAGRQSPWFDKTVTFLCAGGLPHSYMAYTSLAMSLMLDFKCVLNPYMVYASERDWTDALEPVEALQARLDKTVAVKLELAERLKGRAYNSGWEI